MNNRSAIKLNHVVHHGALGHHVQNFYALLARAIVDIELHQGTMTFQDAAGFWRDRVGLSPEAAKAETTKTSMFPGTASTMLYQTQTTMSTEPWLALFPGLFIFVTMLTVNALGEQLAGSS